MGTSEGTYSCTIRGKFRLLEEDATNPVVIGDRVQITLNADDTGVICEREERQNKLSRRAAGRRVGKEHVIIANVDTAWIVQSVREPRINPGFIDRFLVMCEAYGIPAGIVINKVDLMDEAAREITDYFADLYTSLGYQAIYTSARTEKGLDAFRKCLNTGIHVVVGPSGVGKTSLLNKIIPGLKLKTGAVSERTLKGKHTTTYAELVPIPGGGFIGDTPGLREFGLYNIEPQELSHYFVEYRAFLGTCRFPNCTHDHEPGCLIKELVEEGDLAIERYESYINMLNAARLGDQDVGR